MTKDTLLIIYGVVIILLLIYILIQNKKIRKIQSTVVYIGGLLDQIFRMLAKEGDDKHA